MSKSKSKKPAVNNITNFEPMGSDVATIHGLMTYAKWCAKEAVRQTELGTPARVMFDGLNCAVVHR